MGLSIHWEAKDKKAYIAPETAKQCIAFVKEIAQREGWKILAEWDKTINPSEYQKQHEWTKDGEIVKPHPSRRTKTQTIGISVHPHEDCESVEIAFDLTAGKLIRYADYGHAKYSYTSNFCKTHYAGFPTHKKVCRLLEAVDKHFVPLEVHDEGDYYGVWNDIEGKKAFGQYVALVHDIGKQLKQEFSGDNVEVYSSEDSTDGWKEEYVDHLAAEMAENAKTRPEAFSVSSKDLFDKNKNPTLSLSAKDIANNNKIKKEKIK